MPAGFRFARRYVTLTLPFVCAAILVACGGSSGSGASAAGSSSPSGSASPTASAFAGSGGAAPTSCKSIPTSLIGGYIGGVAVVKSLGPPANGVSCEFANAGASSIMIVNIGSATQASFATLRAKSGGGGRTVTSVSGVGSSAFSVSNGGKPGGLSVLSNGLVFTVVSPQPIAKDEALVNQLMQLF